MMAKNLTDNQTMVLEHVSIEKKKRSLLHISLQYSFIAVVLLFNRAPVTQAALWTKKKSGKEWTSTHKQPLSNKVRTTANK